MSAGNFNVGDYVRFSPPEGSILVDIKPGEEGFVRKIVSEPDLSYIVVRFNGRSCATITDADRLLLLPKPPRDMTKDEAMPACNLGCGSATLKSSSCGATG